MKDLRNQDDPFLCNECRALGYCKQQGRISESEKVDLMDFISKQIGDFDNVSTETDQKIATDKEIRSWVPVIAYNKNGSIQIVKRIRSAHDLFHQGEYEKAKDLYQEMLESRANEVEILVGLAASLYFLNKFEEAMAIAERITGYFNEFTQYFIASCIKRQKALENDKVLAEVTTPLEHVESEGEYTIPEILQPAVFA